MIYNISFIELFYDTEMHSRGITNIIKLGIAFAGKHVKIREVR